MWRVQFFSTLEFNLFQIWVLTGSFENDLNIIEARRQDSAVQDGAGRGGKRR